MNLSIGGGVKSSRSKGLQDFVAEKFSYIGIENLPSTVGRGRKIDLSKAKVRFSGEGSDLSDSVKSLVSTAEQTAGLPRSQGYLLPRNDMRKKAAFTLAEGATPIKCHAELVSEDFDGTDTCHYEQIKGLICETDFCTVLVPDSDEIERFAHSAGSETLGAWKKSKAVIQPLDYRNIKERARQNFTVMTKKLDCFVAKLFAPRNDMGKKAAFTLAEVLITLGIIGVVAALTLPTLIQNYQKRVYINQLKKSYSVLSNGFRLMMAHDGVTELKDTHAFSGMGANFCGSRSSTNLNNILTNDCSSIREGLTSVFSGIQFAPCDDIETKYLNGTIIPSTGNGFRKSTHTCIKFPDGSELLSYEFRKDSTTTNGRLYVDINGPKNPNTLGRDIFEFWYFNNGILVPYGSQQVSDVMMSLSSNAEYYAQQGITSFYWRNSTASKKCDISGQGQMCAGRVLEEDAMNY